MSNTSSNTLTRGQLERTLSQSFQRLYREHLGHSTGKVVCQLLKDRLTIIVEDSLTQPEQLLLKTSETELVEQVRSDLDDVIRPKIVSMVEATLGRDVIDIMSDTTLETGRTGIIIILSAEPEIPVASKVNP